MDLLLSSIAATEPTGNHVNWVMGTFTKHRHQHALPDWDRLRKISDPLLHGTNVA
jgi:hypothetical protein